VYLAYHVSMAAPKTSTLHELQNQAQVKPAVSSGFPMERTGIEPVTSGLQSHGSE
jgi:hypothetical protein